MFAFYELYLLVVHYFYKLAVQILYLTLFKLLYKQKVLQTMKDQRFYLQLNATPLTDQKEPDDNTDLCLYNKNLLPLYDRKISTTDTEINLPSHNTHLYTCQKLEDFYQKCRELKTVKKSIIKQHFFVNHKKKFRSNYLKHIKRLTQRVEQLQREVSALKKNQQSCASCQNKLPDYYANLQRHMPTQRMQLDDAGQLKARRNSKDSLEFQSIDFHAPLIETPEMQQKMWVFLGTMLIAIGSKVMDFNRYTNSFKILRNSVDLIRKQIQKSQQSVGMDFFVMKQELEQHNYLYGLDDDPFYEENYESVKKFSLQGVNIETVQESGLFYDFKYHFNMKYDSLIAIMKYAKSNCIIA